MLSYLCSDKEVFVSLALYNERATQINSDAFFVLSQRIAPSSSDDLIGVTNLQQLGTVPEIAEEGDQTPPHRKSKAITNFTQSDSANKISKVP